MARRLFSPVPFLVALGVVIIIVVNAWFHGFTRVTATLALAALALAVFFLVTYLGVWFGMILDTLRMRKWTRMKMGIRLPNFWPEA